MIRYLLILSIFFFSCSKEEAVLVNPYQLELSWLGQGYGLGTKDLLWTKKVDLNNEITFDINVDYGPSANSNFQLFDIDITKLSDTTDVKVILTFDCDTATVRHELYGIVRDGIPDHFNIKDNSNEPLKNLRVLDIGCGGGLMSEPITRLGGKVTGIDASEKNIKVAKLHAEKNNLTINYLNKSPENLDDNEKYDVILNLEIVEHVEDLQLYLKSCSRLLKKNGIMFTATLNRTFTSFIKAILGAEYVLRWLPIGTHDWNKFVKPEELESLITNLNFQIKDVKGLEFKPISRKWVRSENLSVNYIMSSIKN